MITRMDHDLKRYPRLLARLLTGTPLPASCSVQGQITVWTPGLVGSQALHLMQAQKYQLLRPKLSSHGQSSLHQVVGLHSILCKGSGRTSSTSYALQAL